MRLYILPYEYLILYNISILKISLLEGNGIKS